MAAGAALVLVGGIAALMMRAARPQWRTVTFPVDSRTGLAIAIDYPDDWMLDPRRSMEGSLNQAVQFIPKEPNSLVKWCREHLSGHRTVSKLPTTVRFVLSPYVTTSVDELQAIWTSHRQAIGGYFDKVQVTRRTHNLGPELDITQHLARIPGSNSVVEATSYQTMIFFDSQAPPGRMIVNGNCFASSDAPMLVEGRFREVVSRIHLVHVPPR
jgi:hypothetical protein